ncbi:nuclear transport factor 2 family protein [Mucilaginibacter sp.]|uniref:nuclear transport factor 2 family protein n=1 Tax=Mucilaginibacter sp. TaxID=1882438 RepID=UPI0025CDF21E|nr:nuclear transport factor 2 family protein [Mucilaginibacter sp.]
MKTLIIVFATFLISLTAFAQNLVTPTSPQATVMRFFDAIAALDVPAMRAELATDFTLVEHAQVLNADSLTKGLAPLKGKSFKRVNKIDFVKIDEIGDAAWVVYCNTAEVTIGELHRTVKWLESAALVKQGGKWKIKLLHSTDLK